MLQVNTIDKKFEFESIRHITGVSPKGPYDIIKMKVKFNYKDKKYGPKTEVLEVTVPSYLSESLTGIETGDKICLDLKLSGRESAKNDNVFMELTALGIEQEAPKLNIGKIDGDIPF